MNHMVIGTPYVTYNGSNARLCSDITLDSKVTTLWYETEQKYREYFSDDRLDAFLVNLLMYAMQHGYPIKCEAPVSERLYYQLTEYLIPTISSNVREYRIISIDAPLITNLGGGKI